tara:strand:- start:534 stop:872 length:339 start_codon:yes stop_codon:yes gene_type:complete
LTIEHVIPTTSSGVFLLGHHTMAQQPIVRFKPGDRVIHKSNPFSAREGHHRIRHGKVTRIIYKVNKRGARHPYVEMKMDESGHLEVYMASRVEFESNKQQLLDSYVESAGLY